MNINEALNVLNLKGTVTKAEVKKAYKKAAMRFHPDRNPAGAEMMKVINAAFEFLIALEIEEITHTDEANAYDYGEDLAKIIAELLKISGLVIEICGNWVWIDGETKANKDALKALGCLWASKKKRWYYRPAEYKSYAKSSYSMDEIRKKYGSSIMGANVAISAGFKQIKG